MISPRSRIAAPNIQWTNSALGSIAFLEIVEQRPRDGPREEQADGDDEQRRLDHEPPEPLPARVQERDPVRLCERPDEPRERRRRPDQDECPCTNAPVG